jgi:hypothetical protein
MYLVLILVMNYDRKGSRSVLRLENKWKTLIIICLGIFMSTLDGGILNIANPSIAEDFAGFLSGSYLGDFEDGVAKG